MKKENMEREMRKIENMNPLSERLPEYIFNRIHQDVGQASMCWEHPEKGGIFDAKKAGEIAFGLCHFIADVMESKKNTK